MMSTRLYITQEGMSIAVDIPIKSSILDTNKAERRKG